MSGETKVFPSSAFLMASSVVSMILRDGLVLDLQSVMNFGIFHLQHLILVKHLDIQLDLQKGNLLKGIDNKTIRRWEF